MNTQTTQDHADAQLRALLAQADPERDAPAAAPAGLLDRVRAGAPTDGARPDSTSESGGPSGATADPDPAATARGHGQPGAAPPSFLHRHWQGALMAAASIATLALAAGTVLPGLTGSMGGSDSATVSESVATDGSVGAPDMVAREDASDAGAPGDLGAGQDSAAALPGVDEAENTLVRWGSLLVGTDDVTGGRDAFVATVLQMGGRVTSETVVTEDGSGGVDPYLAESMAASRDMVGVGYPYPWYPTGPGIWLSVEVPVEDYDEAMAAARATGEVVQMQQSSYDVGTQISDVDARITALESSLARLTALMDQAEDISDVIALEQAIAERQSELDSLRAQQRDLANQTAMSQISLTLMSPEDARQGVDPTPDQSWWESFLEGLGQLWGWLGQALLILSPLLLAMAIIGAVRRRARRRGGLPTPATPAAPQADADGPNRPEPPAHG